MAKSLSELRGELGREIAEGDRLRVVLESGEELVGRTQSGADVSPPLTPDGEAAGWGEKWTLPAVEVVAIPDSLEDADSMDLTAEKRGGEWGGFSGRAWVYREMDYEDVELDIRSVEAL